MAEKVMGISEEALVRATGKGWDGWFDLLDEAGAAGLSHPQMVAFVAEQGLDKPWWQQMVTSSYERVRGLKEVGETSAGGFQIGVQRTIAASVEALWRVLLSPEGLAVWLGGLAGLDLEPGARYRTDEGTRGEVRSVQEASRLRLTMQPRDRAEPTTLQITLSCPRNRPDRTTLRFHQEKLAGADERERMRERWQTVIGRISALAGSR